MVMRAKVVLYVFVLKIPEILSIVLIPDSNPASLERHDRLT